MVRLAATALLVIVLAACQHDASTTTPATTAAAAPTTTVPATTTTLAWDSAEAIQRVATYCGVAAGDLSPVTSIPEGATYDAPFDGIGLAIVDSEGHISCGGLGRR